MNVNEIWKAALDDAGIDADDALLFVIGAKQSPNGESAKSWLRGTLIDDADDRDALGDRIDEANSDLGLAACRVAIWIERSEEGAAASS